MPVVYSDFFSPKVVAQQEKKRTFGSFVCLLASLQKSTVRGILLSKYCSYS